MSQPLVVDLPHRLGTEEARRRIERGMGRIADKIPGQVKVDDRWTENRLDLRVEAMAQRVTAAIDVGEANVRVELVIPAALSFFRPVVEAALKRTGAELLEDRTRR